MRSSKIRRVFIGTIIGVCILNAVLTFLLEPAQSSSSDNMWYGYQKQESLDTIFVGSSLVSRSLDPEQFDQKMGTHSYNMGTNAQMLAQSYTAVETAWREYQIKTAILGIGYFEFQSRQGLGNEVAFYRARNHYSSGWEAICNNARYVFQPDNFDSSVSVNYFFPWVYDHITLTGKDIAENLREKLEEKSSGKPEKAGNGFSNGDENCLDFNTLSYEDTSSAQKQKEVEPAYDELAKICRFCREKGIALYVINMPLPEYYVVAFPEQYFERAEHIRNVCQENGTEYYDFNVSKPVLFERKDEYYMDFEHMNQRGAEAFTDSVSRLVSAVQNREDISSLFYSKEEYLQSVDRVVCTNFTCEQERDDLHIQAYAYCGTGITPEYRFLIWDEKEKNYEILQDYSENSALVLSDWRRKYEGKLTSDGKLRIRVETRNSGRKNDRAVSYYEENIS